MEAKELMIGDWYVNSDGDKCKVIKNFGKEVWGEGDDVSDSTDNPQPITLTPEIFEKNGFLNIDKLGVEACCGYDVYYKYNDGYSFNLYPLMKPLYYVHELQHALRLCGLNELADNFKV